MHLASDGFARRVHVLGDVKIKRENEVCVVFEWGFYKNLQTIVYYHKANRKCISLITLWSAPETTSIYIQSMCMCAAYGKCMFTTMNLFGESANILHTGPVFTLTPTTRCSGRAKLPQTPEWQQLHKLMEHHGPNTIWALAIQVSDNVFFWISKYFL